MRVFEASLIFRPLPFVRRIVVHRLTAPGATSARERPLRPDYLALVGRPDELADTIKEIEASTAPEVIAPEMRGRTPNAIGNLRTDSPILTTLDRIPIASKSRITRSFLRSSRSAGTDGVVLYNSSHLMVVLRAIVAATHSSAKL